MSLAFWITTLIVVASPGTGVAFTLAAGLSRGARASLVAAFGCTLGIAPHVAAAMLGLAAVDVYKRQPRVKWSPGSSRTASGWASTNSRAPSRLSRSGV